MTELILRQAKEALDKAVGELKVRRSLSLQDSIGKDLANMLTPYLDSIAQETKNNRKDFKDSVTDVLKQMAEENKISRQQLKFALDNIKIQNNISDIKVPDFPEINIPTPEVTINPIFKVPKPEVTVNFDATRIKIPDVIMPKEMDIRGWVQLMGVDLQHPLPVQLRDADGKPVNLLENLTSIVGGAGGGGGKRDFFTIKGFNQSAFAEIMNPDGRVKVEMPVGDVNVLTLPAIPAGTNSDLNDLLQIFKQFVQTPIGRLAIDSAGRLRIIQESVPTTAVTIAAAPVDQRFEMIQRSNIEYSECQRSKFTFA